MTVRGFDGTEEQALPTGGWNRSSKFGAKFCYVPETSAPGLVNLPPVAIDRTVTDLRIDVHGWVGTRVPATQAVASVWVVVPDPTGGTAIYRAVKKK